MRKVRRDSRPRNRWRVRGLTVAVAMSLLAGACGDDGGVAAPGAPSSGDGGLATTTTGMVQAGGSLTMAMYSEARGLDPIQSSGTGVAGGTELLALYDSIMRWNPATSSFEARTAQSLTPNADFTVWTLILKGGITFGDGTPYDSEAVRVSFARHASADNVVNASRSHLQAVESVDIVDDLTVRFTLNESWPGFPYLLADEPGMLVSPTAIAALGDPEASDYKPKLEAFSLHPEGAGAGPFRIVDFTPNESIVMERNPDYWGGNVLLDEVRFVVLPSAEAVLDALTTGTVQAGFIRNPQVLAAAKSAGFVGFENVVQGGELLLLNNGVAVTCTGGEPAPTCTGKADGAKAVPPTATADPLVRRAIAAAIDPQVLINRAYGGEGLPGNELFQSSYAFNPGTAGPKVDVERAAELVEDAKAKGWDGSIRVTCTNSPDRQAIALAVETMLTAVGMDVTTRTDLDVSTQIGEIIQKKNFDIGCWGLNIYPDEGAALLFEQNWKGTAATNRVGYNNPAFDAALATFKMATSEEEKTEAAKELSEIYNEDVPSLIFGATPEFVAWPSNVHGIMPTQATMMLLDQAWIDG